MKICVVADQLPALERLYKATSLNGGIIYRNLIQWAKDPEGCRGYEPPFLKFVRESQERLSRVQEIIGVAT